MALYPSVPSACNPFIPKMKTAIWCQHESRGYSLKFKQVQKRISETHCFVWVKYGETFRDATFAEAAAMRREEVKTPDPTPLRLGRGGEVSGCIYRAPESAIAQNRMCRTLAVKFGFLFGAKLHLQATCTNPEANAIFDTFLAEANRLAAQNG